MDLRWVSGQQQKKEKDPSGGREIGAGEKRERTKAAAAAAKRAKIGLCKGPPGNVMPDWRRAEISFSKGLYARPKWPRKISLSGCTKARLAGPSFSPEDEAWAGLLLLLSLKCFAAL